MDIKLANEQFGLRYNIVRPHNVLGLYQNIWDKYRNVIGIFIRKVLNNEPILIYGDGEQTRAFSDIKYYIEPFEKLIDGFDGEIINIGPDEGTITINEIVSIVAEECKFAEPPIYFPERPREVKDAMCSSDKARKILGYKTTIDVKQAVKNTADWIKNRGPKPFDYSFPLEIINDKTPQPWRDRLM
jgi:UDP-glucose 4-epimerase